MQDIIEEVADERFDDIIVDFEYKQGVTLTQKESLWLGEYNTGFGYRYTFSDGSSFCLMLEHIEEPDEDGD